MKRSNIAWTDFSGGDLNFILRGRATGDCEVSAGCAHCYAGAILRRNGHAPEQTRFYPVKLLRLQHWNVARLLLKVQRGEDPPWRRGAGARPLAFPCDMGDLFHDAVPDWAIAAALDTMRDRHEVDWQILTKRAARMKEIVNRLWQTPPPNIWLGVSVENQKCADERIPLLLQTPATVRFVSMEPMLGPVDLTNIGAYESSIGTWLSGQSALHTYIERAVLNWVIVGAESGPRRRSFEVAWAADIYRQCRAAGVAFFGKQDSALRLGAPLLIGGREIKEFPDDH